MRALVLALLAPAVAAAACPPAPPATWSDVAAGVRPPNVDVVLTATSFGALDPLVGRIRDVGGAVTRVSAADGGVRLEAWLQGDRTRLGGLMRPGRLTLHAVDEGGMRAAMKQAKPPEGVQFEDAGERVRVFGRDAAVLRSGLSALAAPRGAWLIGPASDGRYEAVLAGPAALSESDLDRCSVALQQETWGPQIALRLTPAGATRFAELTRAQVRRRVAIVIDGEVQSAPVVMEPITGGALVIATGDHDVGAARDLMAVLRHGPLPDTLRIAR